MAPDTLRNIVADRTNSNNNYGDAGRGEASRQGAAALLDGHFDFELEEMAHALGERLRQRNGRLVTAESCTGGWLSAAVTAVAGASEWFHVGFSTYSNASKMHFLGVPAGLLRQRGAVSKEAVRSMAEGALRMDPGAVLSVAISGVAGPDAGDDKSAGSVCMAWMLRDQPPISENFVFSGSRNQVRKAAVQAALRGCLKVLTP